VPIYRTHRVHQPIDCDRRPHYQFAKREIKHMHNSPITRAAIVITLAFWPLTAKSSDCGFYRNMNGVTVGRNCASTMQAPPPQRVTALCWDKTYSYDQGRAACVSNGGVQTWLR
jgi:hypothetical protein